MACRECDALRAEIAEWERRYDEYTVQRAAADRVAKWKKRLGLTDAQSKMVIAIVDEPERVLGIDRLMNVIGSARTARVNILSVYMMKIRNALVSHGLPREMIKSVHARGYTVNADAARQIKALVGE